MLFVDLLRLTVLLIGGSATALGAVRWWRQGSMTTTPR